jgi:hypothetical protein
MSKDNWKEPQPMIEQELIDRAGDYLFECLIAHGASMEEIVDRVSERVTVCLNEYETFIGVHGADDDRTQTESDCRP